MKAILSLTEAVLGFAGRHWRGLAILALLSANLTLLAAGQRKAQALRTQTARLEKVLDAAASCDQAILLGGWNTRCSSAVQRLAEQAGAGAQTLISARAALDAADEDRDAAVARAEARCITQAQRTARAQDARRGAVVDGDGLRVYDAERLRLRWQQP